MLIAQLPTAHLTDNPFAVLSFLAAPAILTNSSTVLALGTSNRLARAADRARLTAGQLLSAQPATAAATSMVLKDFQAATKRAQLLVRALRLFYLAAGSFAAATCVALLGAFAGYFGLEDAIRAAELATIVLAIIGVYGLVAGCLRLVAETRIALRVLGEQLDAIEAWRGRSERPEPPVHLPSTG